MAVVIMLKFPGVSLEQYDKVREITNFEGDAPDGGIFHVCAQDGNGLRIVDVWESQEAFDAFGRERLQAGLQQAGIAGAPEVEVLPAHNIFAPAFK